MDIIKPMNFDGPTHQMEMPKSDGDHCITLLNLPDEVLVQIFTYVFAKGDNGRPTKRSFLDRPEQVDPPPPCLLTCQGLYRVAADIAYSDVDWTLWVEKSYSPPTGPPLPIQRHLKRLQPARLRYMRYMGGHVRDNLAVIDFSQHPDNIVDFNEEQFHVEVTDDRILCSMFPYLNTSARAQYTADNATAIRDSFLQLRHHSRIASMDLVASDYRAGYETSPNRDSQGQGVITGVEGWLSRFPDLDLKWRRDWPYSVMIKSQ